MNRPLLCLTAYTLAMVATVADATRVPASSATLEGWLMPAPEWPAAVPTLEGIIGAIVNEWLFRGEHGR